MLSIMGRIPIHRFAETGEMYLALVPRYSRPGNVIAILKGASRPVVLRKHNDYYGHVGACYLHGLMDGEAAELLKAGFVKVETARIK